MTLPNNKLTYDETNVDADWCNFLICPDELKPGQRLDSMWTLKPGESGQWEETANDIHPSGSPHSHSRSSAGGHTGLEQNDWILDLIPLSVIIFYNPTYVYKKDTLW